MTTSSFKFVWHEEHAMVGIEKNLSTNQHEKKQVTISNKQIKIELKVNFQMSGTKVTTYDVHIEDRKNLQSNGNDCGHRNRESCSRTWQERCPELARVKNTIISWKGWSGESEMREREKERERERERDGRVGEEGLKRKKESERGIRASQRQ